eukprot:TRINITY_DN22662_c0_g1_i1.p1 TRINITY_DN22662_c0_g1~~TRINITY_DN22662_c0_g1_i1.p1  ORF type:complete len:232 (-),score=41.27 TRINITY_DN22662_c0_g1_i1:262-957(-)
MAQAVASMAGLCSASKTLVEGSLVSSSCNQLRSATSTRIAVPKAVNVAVRAHHAEDFEVQSRRSMLGLLAATIATGALVREARAEVTSLELKPPPAPYGGFSGTGNADEARDIDLPLKQRFFLQEVSPEVAVARAKESADAIIGVKSLIDKQAWTYVQNELRNKAGYLRFDLKTIINSKPKPEKKSLQALVSSLFTTIDGLDYAARAKSPSSAEKYYNLTVNSLESVLSKL